MAFSFIDQAGNDLAASQRTAQVLQGAVNSYFQNKFAGDQNARAQDLFDFQMKEAKRQQNINENLPGELLPGQMRPNSAPALSMDAVQDPLPRPPLPPTAGGALPNVTMPAVTAASPVPAASGPDARFAGLTPQQIDAAKAADEANEGVNPSTGILEALSPSKIWSAWASPNNPLNVGGQKELYSRDINPGADSVDVGLKAVRQARLAKQQAAAAGGTSGDPTADSLARMTARMTAGDPSVAPVSNAIASMVSSPAHPTIVPGSQPGAVTPPTNPTTSSALPDTALSAPSVLPDVTMPQGAGVGGTFTPSISGSQDQSPHVQMASQLPQAVLQQLLAQGAKMGATPSETVAAINANANAMQGGQAIFHTPATAEMVMALSAKGVPPSAYLDSNGNVDFSRAAVAEAQMTRMMLEVQLQKFEREGAGAGDVRAMRTSGEEAAKLGPQLNSLDGVIRTMTDPSVPDAVKLQTGYQARSLLRDMGVDTTLSDKYLEGGFHNPWGSAGAPGQSIHGASLSPLLAHLQSIRAEQSEKLNTLRAQVKKISEANGFGTAVSDVLAGLNPTSPGAAALQPGKTYKRADGTQWKADSSGNLQQIQ